MQQKWKSCCSCWQRRSGSQLTKTLFLAQCKINSWMSPWWLFHLLLFFTFTSPFYCSTFTALLLHCHLLTRVATTLSFLFFSPSILCCYLTCTRGHALLEPIPGALAWSQVTPWTLWAWSTKGLWLGKKTQSKTSSNMIINDKTLLGRTGKILDGEEANTLFSGRTVIYQCNFKLRPLVLCFLAPLKVRR